MRAYYRTKTRLKYDIDIVQRIDFQNDFRKVQDHLDESFSDAEKIESKNYLRSTNYGHVQMKYYYRPIVKWIAKEQTLSIWKLIFCRSCFYFAIVALGASIAIHSTFYVVVRITCFPRTFICLSLRHVDKVQYKLFAYIFVFRFGEI